MKQMVRRRPLWMLLMFLGIVGCHRPETIAGPLLLLPGDRRVIALSGEPARGIEGELCIELATPVAHSAQYALRRSNGSEFAIHAAVQNTRGAMSMTPAELQAVPPQPSSLVCFRTIGSIDGLRPRSVVLSATDSVSVRAVRWWTGTRFAGP